MTDTAPPQPADIVFDPTTGLPMTPARRALEWLKLVAGGAAVIGGIAYATVTIALNHFYGAFGVTPQEVGWDVTTTLARFAFSLTVMFLLGAFLVTRFRERALARTGDLVGLFTTGWGQLALPAIVVGIGVLLTLFAQQKVDILRGGGALAASLDSAVPVSAPCTHVVWTDADAAVQASVPMLRPDTRFALLGATEGTVVLYEPTAHATLRIPADRVVLRSCDARVASR
jgi:hypothetical protein